jgi:hypothetical protein
MGVIQQLSDEMVQLSAQAPESADPVRMQALLRAGAYMLLRLEEQYEETYALVDEFIRKSEPLNK